MPVYKSHCRAIRDQLACCCISCWYSLLLLRLLVKTQGIHHYGGQLSRRYGPVGFASLLSHWFKVDSLMQAAFWVSNGGDPGSPY